MSVLTCCGIDMDDYCGDSCVRCLLGLLALIINVVQPLFSIRIFLQHGFRCHTLHTALSITLVVGTLRLHTLNAANVHFIAGTLPSAGTLNADCRNVCCLVVPEQKEVDNETIICQKCGGGACTSAIDDSHEVNNDCVATTVQFYNASTARSEHTAAL